MKQKNYNALSGIIFLVIAIGHLLRAINGWPVVVSSWAVPVSLSWVALLVGFYLAYQAFQLNKK